MRKLTLSAVLAALLLPGLLVATADAAEPAGSVPGPSPAHFQQAEDDEHDVVPVAVWTVVGVVVFGLVGGVFYLLKRRVGGFPRNPTWVAPISIERSETFAGEGDFGDAPADAHGTHH